MFGARCGLGWAQPCRLAPTSEFRCMRLTKLRVSLIAQIDETGDCDIRLHGHASG